MASPVETQQAFLEGHALAFDWFGGVFGEVRYDNLGSAVKKVLRGRRRVETDRFVALRSHYLFESLFTTPGSRARMRRAVWRARSAGSGATISSRSRRSGRRQLNRLLVNACERDLARRIAGRPVTVAEQLAANGRCCGRCRRRSCDRADHGSGRRKALVTVRQNRYSVPVALAGLRVSAAIGATEIRVTHRDRRSPARAAHGKRRTRASSITTSSCSSASPARSPVAAAAPGTRRGAWPALLRRAVDGAASR